MEGGPRPPNPTPNWSWSLSSNPPSPAACAPSLLGRRGGSVRPRAPRSLALSIPGLACPGRAAHPSASAPAGFRRAPRNAQLVTWQRRSPPGLRQSDKGPPSPLVVIGEVRCQSRIEPVPSSVIRHRLSVKVRWAGLEEEDTALPPRQSPICLHRRCLISWVGSSLTWTDVNKDGIT